MGIRLRGRLRVSKKREKINIQYFKWTRVSNLKFQEEKNVKERESSRHGAFEIFEHLKF